MPMHIPVQAAAASAASMSSSRRKKGRWRDEYGDEEPDEEATLLGESERDPGFFHDDVDEDRPMGAGRVHDAAPQVRTRLVNPILMTSRGLGVSDQRFGEGQRTNPGPFPYDLQVRKQHDTDAYSDNVVHANGNKRQTAEQVHCEHCPQSEVQCVHVSAHRLLRTIQVFLQPLFPPRRPIPVHTRPQNR